MATVMPCSSSLLKHSSTSTLAPRILLGQPLQHCRLPVHRRQSALQTRALYIFKDLRGVPSLTKKTVQFGLGKKAPKTVARETIVPEPSYAIPAVLAGIAVLSTVGGAKIPAAISGVLGAFLAFQASRVRFRFEPDALEVVIGEQEEKSENSFVGGENRWKYDTFTNWEYWWPGFPVLVYFKETQTKPEGQIHFFPIIFNGKQVYDVMVERCGPSQNSGPK